MCAYGERAKKNAADATTETAPALAHECTAQEPAQRPPPGWTFACQSSSTEKETEAVTLGDQRSYTRKTLEEKHGST